MESAITDMVRVSQNLLSNTTSYPRRPRFHGLHCFLFDAKQNEVNVIETKILFRKRLSLMTVKGT